LILLFLVLTWGANRRSFAGGVQYDPPPLPDPPFDIPFPDDPPPIFDDPFDPINDLPDPIEIPFPPEDLPDPFDLPLPEPPLPDLPDPFDEPSLFPDPFDDIPDPPFDLPPLSDFPEAFEPKAAGGAPAFLAGPMPFPMRLPFHPVYSGVSAPKTVPACNAAAATTLLVAESKNNTVLFMGTCPFAVIQRVSVGAYPVAVRVTPDGQSAWVANADSSTVSILSLASKTVVATIPLPQFNGDPAEPNGVVFTPDGSTAYVTNHDANPGSVIFVIDVASRGITTIIPTDAFPASAAVTPDGSTLWVPNRADSTITIVDTLTNTVTGHISADVPTGIAFNPTGTRAYVAEAELGNTVGYLRVFDVSSTATIARIPVGGLPHVVKVAPSGHYIFVTNMADGTISEISPFTNTVIQTIPVPGQHPFGIAFLR
jgi:YVTN family beta-propeller protein